MKDKMNLLNEILQWAEEQKIKFKREEEGIIFNVSGENGNWYTRVNALEEEQMVFILTAYPFYVPEENRKKTAVALGNITGQLKMGAFYINMENGQICFRICQRIFAQADSDIWVRELIMFAMKITDVHLKTMKEYTEK